MASLCVSIYGYIWIYHVFIQEKYKREGKWQMMPKNVEKGHSNNHDRGEWMCSDIEEVCRGL